MQPSSAIPTWIVVLAILSIVFSLLPWKVQPITPALLVYSWPDSPLSILVSPFLVPSWHAAIARVAQLAWLATQSASTKLRPSYFVNVYPAILAARAGSGFIFSRSVGWAYPNLFSHSALYEPVAGIGPLLLGALLFDEVRDQRHLLGRYAIMAAFLALDLMPWSYICGAAVAGIYHLAGPFLPDGKYTLLPWTAPDAQPANSPPLSRVRIVALSIAAMVLSGATGALSDALMHIHSSSPSPPSDVHVVMLTVPRTRDLLSDVMIESVLSYVEPWQVNVNSSITVFAHLGPDGKHPAFDRTRAFFHTRATQSTVPLAFHVEPWSADGPPVMNHHTHLADAMRFAYVAGHEWSMFVEDDFVLCGDVGWEAFKRVMERLNSDGKKLNGAFIGTGGSGLILHRTLLPILEQLLKMIPALDAKAVNHPFMPPDVLIQQCLSGEILLCPNTGWVISSRLLMGHRGGSISTGNRIYEDGKWACGWRHPQHGRKGAEVIAV